MASGDTLAVLTPLHFISPASNGAALDFRNNHPVLDFDPTTEESAWATFIIPANYSGGGLTTKTHTMATSATSGDYIVATAIEAEGTDNDSDSFAAESQSSAVTTSATSGIETIATTTHTAGAQMDSAAAGNRVRLKLLRKAAEAGDNMAGDLEVTAVEVKET